MSMGCSTICEVVTQEHTITIHKHIHIVGFKQYAPSAPKDIQTFTMKKMGTPDIQQNYLC